MASYVVSFSVFTDIGKPLGISHIGIESEESTAKDFLNQVEFEALSQTKASNEHAHAVVITSIFKL
ncbi:hypothetical protein ABN135_03330 [Enterobacter hormaechei]|uniref:hypothetical protein n=1 Tax=Enterobacter hormaechei TaxID=158836 RepID=UPI0032DA6851